jgi:hypothetical protein
MVMFLTPLTSPIDDKELDRIFHTLLVGLTSLDVKLVRPRWEIDLTNIPPLGTNWLAHGIYKRKDDVLYDKDLTGSVYSVSRNQELTILLSFYGLNAYSNHSKVRDGLAIDLNRQYLVTNGMNLVKVGEPMNRNEKINTNWVKRVDCELLLTRRLVSTYQINSILTAEVIQHVENITNTLHITQ